MTSEWQAEDMGEGSRSGQKVCHSLPPSLTGLSLTGHCAALPVSQKHVSREGWLHHVWVPEAAAHVSHGDAGDDQPHPVHR